MPKIAQASLCLQYLSLAEIVIWKIISGEGIMAQTERLPIYKSAYDPCLYFEQVVRNFSRYHKYSIGADLRNCAREVLKLVVRANSRRD